MYSLQILVVLYCVKIPGIDVHGLYRARVSYVPQQLTPPLSDEATLNVDQWIENSMQNVIKTIEDMANSTDIVVFPEVALIHQGVVTAIEEDKKRYAVEVGAENTNACDAYYKNYSNIKNISCSLKESRVYAVLSVIDTDNATLALFHVVVDRNGTVLKKCKRHRTYLSGKWSHTKTPCIFVASVHDGTNVSFAIVDNMNEVWQSKANVSNVIFNGLWEQHEPASYGSTVLLAGIAKRNKITILIAAATLDDAKKVSYKNGIYSFYNHSNPYFTKANDKNVAIPTRCKTQDTSNVVYDSSNVQRVSFVDRKTRIKMPSFGSDRCYCVSESFCCTFHMHSYEDSIVPYKWIVNVANTFLFDENVHIIECGIAKPLGSNATVLWQHVTITSSFDENIVTDIIPVCTDETLSFSEYTYFENTTTSSLSYFNERDSEQMLSCTLIHVIKNDNSVLYYVKESIKPYAMVLSILLYSLYSVYVLTQII